MPTLDNVELENKTVLIRLDLNSPYDEKTKKILDNERMDGAKKTLLELSQKKAKTVIMAHQARKGEPDFTHLDQHAFLLSKKLRKPVKYVDDVCGDKAKKAIKALKPGEILLLDNVRMIDDEEDEKKALSRQSTIVKALYPLADVFVNDAFSVSHRAHASVVGFTMLESCFGRLMESEIEAAEKAMDAKGINTYILGGAKSDDCINIMDHIIKVNPDDMEYGLTCGVTANLFMKAAGIRIGKGSEAFIEKKDLSRFVDKCKEMLDEYPDRILLPEDVAIEQNNKRVEVPASRIPEDASVLDIGPKTVEKYKKILNKSKTIIVKGPAGLYENKLFSSGTKEILNAVSKTKAFTIVGGGDTNMALDALKIPRAKFSHVSLGGGALITFLSGKPMPGIEAILKR